MVGVNSSSSAPSFFSIRRNFLICSTRANCLLTRSAEVQKLIGSEIERVNQQFARVEQVKKFRLIEKKLGAEDEELTPTMKLKRKLVSQKYAELIESMYRD